MNNNDVKYRGINILNKTEPDVKKGDELCIIFYSISSVNKSFLEFLFYNNNNDVLELIKFKYDGNTPSKEAINIINKIFVNYDFTIKYVGYINNIIFIETRVIDEWVIYKERKDELWFLISDEIINKKKSLHMIVDETIVNIFLKNPSLLYLEDNNNSIIESPIISYHGNYYNKIKANVVYGVFRGTHYASLGPYYYFSSYSNAIEYAVWNYKRLPYKLNNVVISDEKGKNKEGGLVRFAIFLGKTKILHDIKDINNNWIETYDSIISKIKTDKICINKYDDYKPLTYHYINTNSIKTDDDISSIVIK
tara:strand:+ start:5877 stop:6800 length:924 start_codon:yes stop_codon:yes gene_type:complete